MSEQTAFIAGKPDLHRAETAAWEFLCQIGADHFPVTAAFVFDALRQYVTLLKWTEARTVMDTPDPFSLRKTHSDARCEKSRAGGRFIIVYDDEIDNPARLRFILMHEVGHILLGHMTGPVGATKSLTDAEYDKLEKESSRFAAEVLCPSPFFRHFDHIQAPQLKSLCYISGGCADRQEQAIRLRRAQPLDHWDQELLRRFYDHFVKTPQSLSEPECEHRLMREDILPRSRVCDQCSAWLPGEHDRFCSHCGARRESNSATVGFVPFMLRGRPRCCPLCLNDDLRPEDKYCMICGQPLLNTCLQEGRTVPFGARYCPVCGKETAFLQMYRQADLVLQKLNRYSETTRWHEYPHTAYLRLRASQMEDPALYAALLYSRIFTDDENRLLVLTPHAGAQEDVIRYSGDLLSICGEYGVRHPSIGVYTLAEDPVKLR